MKFDFPEQNYQMLHIADILDKQTLQK